MEQVTKFYKYGLVFIKDNKILLCEPHAYKDLILPGGTKDGDENYLENLQREVVEELGDKAILEIDSLKYIGNFADVAAGRTYRLVEIETYLGNVKGELKPSSEIKALHWFSTSDSYELLSPIIRNKILPYLIEHKYIQ
jgi:ADP-ribose pyrophosphatase YjhB (NUDIX family)